MHVGLIATPFEMWSEEIFQYLESLVVRSKVVQMFMRGLHFTPLLFMSFCFSNNFAFCALSNAGPRHYAKGESKEYYGAYRL